MTYFKPSTTILVIYLQCLVVFAQPVKVSDSGELELALKKLTVLGSALYIAAHPDDENTRVLSYLSKERLVRTGYLSLTRGDGGQNRIGTETGELLGIVRTHELLSARGIDGAEQFFTRAIDFGYSKSAKETLNIWDKEKILSDVVWVIRKFRPDVILTRFTPQKGGHGHHLASAILAEEAFHAAGNPTRFPEQLKYVDPWQPKRLLWDAFFWRVDTDTIDFSRYLQMDVGTYNPLLGMSYAEVSAKSRSMHKSQGFGDTPRRGSVTEYFQHTTGDKAKLGLFEGVDLSWARVPGGNQVEKLLQKAYAQFDPESPAKILPLLIEANKLMAKLEANPHVKLKKQELKQVIRECAGIWMEAIAKDYAVTPGGEIQLEAMMVNRSDFPFTLEKIRFAYAKRDSIVKQSLPNNEPVRLSTTISLSDEVDFTQPFWLREQPGKGAFNISNQTLAHLPVLDETQPQSPLPAVKFFVSAQGETFEFNIPILYRWTDAVDGEQYREIEIVPSLTVNLEGNLYVFPDERSKEIHLNLKSNQANLSGTAKLNLPEGWWAEPETIPFLFAKPGDQVNRSVTLYPPKRQSSGTLTVEIEAQDQWQARSAVQIDYPHIPIQNYFPKTQAKLVRLDLKKRGDRIGYIMGSGDEIPAALQQINYQVDLLSDQDLSETNLSMYDAIIVGIRAYNTREQLAQQQERLLEYVHSGGTMIVQYNKSWRLKTEEIGPYPIKLSHDRVTVEEAPIRFLAPDHPLLNSPNKITQADFQNWVQERGLYFSNQWDEAYQPILSSHDPGEESKKGGLLFARYGKGVYIYTGYSWFRQLPAGVPGAYRIFVNMISMGNGES